MELSNEYHVSFYKNVKDTLGQRVLLNDIINAIKNGTYKDLIFKIRSTDNKKERNVLKTKLPAFTMSTFSKRASKAIINYNGLIVIDFDNVDDLDLVLFKLKKDRFTHIAFISPSGNGFKIIVKVPNKHENHLVNFLSLQDYYMVNFNLHIDKACKDLNRLCFVSFDENLFTNENAAVYNEVYHPNTQATFEVFQGNTPTLNETDNGIPIENLRHTQVNQRNTSANLRNVVENLKQNETKDRIPMENPRHTLVNHKNTSVNLGNNAENLKQSVTKDGIPMEKLRHTQVKTRNTTRNHWNSRNTDLNKPKDQKSTVEDDIRLIVERIEKNQIDITNGYNNWYRIAFSLVYIFGEYGRNLFHSVSFPKNRTV